MNATTTYRTPTKAEISKSASEILEYKITEYRNEATRLSMQKLCAAMDGIYGDAVVYLTHIEELELNHQTLVDHLPGYEPLPKQLQNKYKEGLKSAHKEAISEVKAMVELIKSFTCNINGWEPEYFENLMQKQAEMGV